MWCTRSLLLQVIATIDAFVLQNVLYPSDSKKKRITDNSFRYQISALDEFKFECENAVLWISKMLCMNLLIPFTFVSFYF